VSVHFFVQFEPAQGKEAEFRTELLQITEPSRAEAGCLALRVFESLREPHRFTIHSEWADEAAFEWHAQLPHTVRFLRAAEALLTHEVQGLRTREIAGGPGAGSAGSPVF
jgi:quinol monooxygenase YgiN